MVMRGLTRDWHGSGENPLSDAEVTARTAAYQRHREAVLPQLPDDLKTLAGQPVDGQRWILHDGRVEAWGAELPDRVVLQIVCGEFGHGYERLTVEYRSAELIGASEHDLAAWLGNERTELLYQEVDDLPDGRFEHRHLLWSQGEFGIRFNDIAVTASAVPADAYDQARRPAAKLSIRPSAASLKPGRSRPRGCTALMVRDLT